MTHNLKLTPPSNVVLQLSFDADQHGSDLGHALLGTSPDTPNPAPAKGPHADSMYFAPGTQLTVRVTGTASKDSTFDAFQIIDCAIITRPQVVQRGVGLPTMYAAPSPFLQATGACYQLPLDFHAEFNPLKDDGGRVVNQTWKRTLDVSLSPGLWELSLVLTVRIIRGPGSIEEIRVFSFDPETEVGSTGTLR